MPFHRWHRSAAHFDVMMSETVLIGPGQGIWRWALYTCFLVHGYREGGGQSSIYGGMHVKLLCLRSAVVDTSAEKYQSLFIDT